MYVESTDMLKILAWLHETMVPCISFLFSLSLFIEVIWLANQNQVLLNMICIDLLTFAFWQLVYQLFTTDVEPGEEDIKIVMQMAEEAVRAQERDPYTAFANRVRELNYGNSYFFRVCLIHLLKWSICSIGLSLLVTVISSYAANQD